MRRTGPDQVATFYSVADHTFVELNSIVQIVWELAGNRENVFVPQWAILVLAESRGIGMTTEETLAESLEALTIYGVLLVQHGLEP